MSIDIHFGDGDWERIERDYAAWWAHDLDRPLVQVTGRAYARGATVPHIHKFQSNYPLHIPPEQVIADIGLDLEATRYHGDAFPRWWVNFGPGIMAGFLGARVNSVDETVWFEAATPVAARDLHLRYDAENVWWRRVQALTRVAVETWGDGVQVSHTDLGGNLDILASFRTTQGLLYDLYDAPEQVARLVGEVTALWIRYYAELAEIIQTTGRGYTPWAPIWSAQPCYMLQCDFGYMISPEMFTRFVIPDLVACCDYLENGFYHLDGPGQIAHLDLLLDLSRLRGIQWVPGDGNPPPNAWLDLLKRIIDAGKLCQIYVTAEGALDVVRHLGGRGFILTVQDEMAEDEAHAFLRRVRAEDVSRRR